MRALQVAGNVTYSPSAGVYTRCAWVSGKELCGPFAIEGLATPSHIFPGCWKAALVLLFAGLAVASMSALASILAICKQALCRKSIFTISGAAQAVAAILYILGFVLYPGGWGSPRAQKLCGDEAAPFYPAECSIGWGLYAAVGSMGLTLLCALLSMQADIATSSDKVEFQIQQGRSLICL
ncbi:Lipoma HMGIC fusion partner-like 2 protein, partial [Gryllus bimaculatus]